LPPREPEQLRPEILRLLAPNPGPMTLAGTNTWIVGRDPALVIDPGPADDGHLEAIEAAAAPLGGVGGALLTHSHRDHSEAVDALGAELLWGGTSTVDESSALLGALASETVEAVVASEPAPTAAVGALEVVPTPGHSADHVAFRLGEVVFCGDLILGEGSSIVPPRAAGGSLADYLASLDRIEALDAEVLLPGHGPPIPDPGARIAGYREHRLQRERRLARALDRGERSRAALLGEVWDDVPPSLRAAAALAMQAHLEKLAGEGRRLDDLRP
jgi:glyoxylase-like metal-dependent hydrolase (beta-lactamase superfamily II)